MIKIFQDIANRDEHYRQEIRLPATLVYRELKSSGCVRNISL